MENLKPLVVKHWLSLLTRLFFQNILIQCPRSRKICLSHSIDFTHPCYIVRTDYASVYSEILSRRWSDVSFIDVPLRKGSRVRTYPAKMVELLPTCRTASAKATDATAFYLSPLYTTDNLIHYCLLENNFINDRFRADRRFCTHLPYLFARSVSFSIVPGSFESETRLWDSNRPGDPRSRRRLKLATNRKNESRHHVSSSRVSSSLLRLFERYKLLDLTRINGRSKEVYDFIEILTPFKFQPQLGSFKVDFGYSKIISRSS